MIRYDKMKVAIKETPSIIMETSGIRKLGGFEHARSTAGGEDKLLYFENFPIAVQNGLIEDLENTRFYRDNGYVWAFLGNIGIRFDNLCYRFDKTGWTIEEMFSPTRDNNGRTFNEGATLPGMIKVGVCELVDNWLKLPFRERANFFKGSGPLQLYLYREDNCDRRLMFAASARDDYIAPIVISTVDDHMSDIDFFRKRFADDPGLLRS